MKTQTQNLIRLLLAAPLAALTAGAAESAVKSTFITTDTPKVPRSASSAKTPSTAWPCP